MENKNNTDGFVKITQNKEELEINGKKVINYKYRLQVENMNVLEMYNVSMYLLECIIKHLKSEGRSLTTVLAAAFAALENANCMVVNEKDTTQEVK